MSCKRTQEFLANNDVSTKEEVNAKKERFGRDEALALLDGINVLTVAKGKKVVEYKLNKKDRPDDDTLASVMLGPTGNLRAPTIRRGKKMIVGFNEDAFSSFFA